jgi:hypothetical protein
MRNNHLFALTGGIYSGKTTLARYLQEYHGYYLINFTDVLKRRAVCALTACGVPVTLEDILSKKSLYRGLLQELGGVIGFNDDPRFVDEACEGWVRAGCPDDVVFDNVRTPEQWDILRGIGFTLVEIEISLEEQVQRAECAGVSRPALVKVMEHQIEGVLSGLGDITLRGDARSMYRALVNERGRHETGDTSRPAF